MDHGKKTKYRVLLFQVRLNQVNANDCPTGFEPPSRGQKQEKGFCENTTKPATSFSFHDPKLSYHTWKDHSITVAVLITNTTFTTNQLLLQGGGLGSTIGSASSPIIPSSDYSPLPPASKSYHNTPPGKSFFVSSKIVFF